MSSVLIVCTKEPPPPICEGEEGSDGCLGRSATCTRDISTAGCGYTWSTTQVALSVSSSIHDSATHDSLGGSEIRKIRRTRIAQRGLPFFHFPPGKDEGHSRLQPFDSIVVK